MKNKRPGLNIPFKSLDELLGADDAAGITELPVADIHPFSDHPFKVNNDKRMEELIQSIKGIGKLTAQRIIVDLRDKIVALGIADEIPAGGSIAAPIDNAVRDEAVAALTMLGFSPAPTQKVVVGILQQQPALPVEQVVKLALKQIK